MTFLERADCRGKKLNSVVIAADSEDPNASVKKIDDLKALVHNELKSVVKHNFKVNYRRDKIALGAAFYGKYLDDQVHSAAGGVKMDRHIVDVEDGLADANTQPH